MMESMREVSSSDDVCAELWREGVRPEKGSLSDGTGLMASVVSKEIIEEKV